MGKNHNIGCLNDMIMTHRTKCDLRKKGFMIQDVYNY